MSGSGPIIGEATLDGEDPSALLVEVEEHHAYRIRGSQGAKNGNGLGGVDGVEGLTQIL